jgi:hypothetical protein
LKAEEEDADEVKRMMEKPMLDEAKKGMEKTPVSGAAKQRKGVISKTLYWM